MFRPLQLGSMHWPHLSVGECGMFVNQAKLLKMFEKLPELLSKFMRLLSWQLLLTGCIAISCTTGQFDKKREKKCSREMVSYDPVFG